MKVIIGAEKEASADWMATTTNELDPIDIKSFYTFFKKPSSVDAFLLEHILEHYTLEEGKIIANNLYEFLKVGGYARVAVPDINFHNKAYYERAKVGGPGPASTHKVFFDYKTLTSLFEEAGFKVDLLEYCDEKGRFHFNDWKKEDGMVERSYRYSFENKKDSINMLSIIIDAYKR